MQTLTTLSCRDHSAGVIEAAATILRTVDGKVLPPFPDRLVVVGRTVVSPAGAIVDLLPSPALLRWLADVIEDQRTDVA